MRQAKAGLIQSGKSGKIFSFSCVVRESQGKSGNKICNEKSQGKSGKNIFHIPSFSNELIFCVCRSFLRVKRY